MPDYHNQQLLPMYVRCVAMRADTIELPSVKCMSVRMRGLRSADPLTVQYLVQAGNYIIIETN